MMYYESIDEFPLWNWEKCNAGDLKYTRVNHKLGVVKKDLSFWEILYDQYLEKFGLAKDHLSIIELKLEMADLQCEYTEDGQAFLLNKIKRLEREIVDILSRSTEGSTIDECLMYLSKWMGFKINKKEVTVTEFNTYLKAYDAEAKSQRQKPQ